MWQPIDKAPLNKMLAIVGKKDGKDILTHGVVWHSTVGILPAITVDDCEPRLFVELPEDFNP